VSSFDGLEKRRPNWRKREWISFAQLQTEDLDKAKVEIESLTAEGARRLEVIKAAIKELPLQPMTARKLLFTLVSGRQKRYRVFFGGGDCWFSIEDTQTGRIVLKSDNKQAADNQCAELNASADSKQCHHGAPLGQFCAKCPEGTAIAESEQTGDGS